MGFLFPLEDCQHHLLYRTLSMELFLYRRVNVLSLPCLYFRLGLVMKNLSLADLKTIFLIKHFSPNTHTRTHTHTHAHTHTHMHITRYLNFTWVTLLNEKILRGVLME